MLCAHWRPPLLNAEARVKTSFLPPPIYKCKLACYQYVMFYTSCSHGPYSYIGAKVRKNEKKAKFI